MPFSKLGLPPNLMQGVRAMGFTEPTPVQTRAIPAALRGADLLVCAQTGSGKTASYALPVLARLGAQAKPGVRALILVPTRELAAQVETAFRDCGRFSPFKMAVVIGGMGFHAQRQAIAEGAAIVVATPGRLLDHLKQGSIRMGGVEALVLDEADRMLDMGFLPSIRDVIGRLPKQRQTLLFSATLTPEIDKIAAFATRSPQRIEISRPTSVAEGISQVVYPVSQHRKAALLLAIIEATEIRSGVIFCRTKHGADRAAKRLKAAGLSIGILHANRTQGQRTQAMESFRAGHTKLLVATDIAARGIDVREVSHVINYDLPRHPEDYVHRVGRTARAYGVGDAISLMCPDEVQFLKDIEKFIGVTFPRATLPRFDYNAQPHSAEAPKPPLGPKFGQFRRRRRQA